MSLEEMKNLSPEKQKLLSKKIGMERQKGKTTNYSSVYGAGGKTIAKAADIPEQSGFDLHKAYWELNWAVKAIANDQTIKLFYKMGNGDITYKLYKGVDLISQDNDSRQTKIDKQRIVRSAESMWLLNPINNLWYSLRFPKDIFSTLIQGSGTYAFDLWIKNVLKKRVQITGQFHDEIILTIIKDRRKQCEKLLRDAIKATNEELKLNRELDIDVQFGDNYAEIH